MSLHPQESAILSPQSEIGRESAIRNPQSAIGRSAIRDRYRAPFSLRCGAVLIDYIILVLVVALSTLVARMVGGGARSAGNTAEKTGFILALVAAVLDFGIVAGATGQTAGKWATGLRIERMDGRPLGIGRALLRHFVGYPVSLLPLGLGFIVAILSLRGRALHDRIAGTIVVRDETRRV
jgi:uncharacterized RDD family membrane protein YckC